MPTLELSDEQVMALVRQLPPERRNGIFHALADERRQEREDISQHLQPRIRKVAAERGRDWDAMDEDDRERFIDDLLHED